MKTNLLKFKTVLFIVFAAWNTSSFAQVEMIMYGMKSDTVAFLSRVSDIDNVTFEDAASDEALFVHRKDASFADTILLNNIQQISFSENELTVEMLIDNKVYELDNIAMLLFGKDGTVGINNPPIQNSPNVSVFISPTGDITVESSATIKSLRLFSTDGKMISLQHCKGEETRCAISLQSGAAGIYLVQVETAQGTVVKKIVKPFNK